MFSKKIILGVVSGLFVLATANVVAREASEGPRGADRVHSGTHKNIVDVDSYIVAREAAEGPRGADNERPGDRQRRGGRLSTDFGADILARRGADDPIPHPRGEGAGHPNSVDVNSNILARRGADDPVGSERPGEVHGQKRGGRLSDDAGTIILAREAAEGPRGADNERPGDRQRRGGRTA
jgi:hypothetical protein